MLVVETVGRIRREHFVKGKSIKQLVRELKVSRNTVRKVLRSGAICFEYAREVQPLPKLGPWRADLDRMLATNKAKSGRERLTLIRLFEELRGLGYEGGYDAVRRYARTRRQARCDDLLVDCLCWRPTRCRQLGDRFRPQCVHPHRPRDVLDALLA